MIRLLPLFAFCILNGYLHSHILGFLSARRLDGYERFNVLAATIAVVLVQALFVATWFLGVLAVSATARLWYGAARSVTVGRVALISSSSLVPAVVASVINMKIVFDTLDAPYATSLALTAALARMAVLTIVIRMSGAVASLAWMVVAARQAFGWPWRAAVTIVVAPQVALLLIYAFIKVATAGS